MLIEHGPDGPTGRRYRTEEVYWLDVNLETVQEVPARWAVFDSIMQWCHSSSALVSVGYPELIAHDERNIPGLFTVGFPQMADLLVFKITFGGQADIQQVEWVDGRWRHV